MNIFVAGILFYAALRSLNQDFIGKEKYIKAMDLLWMDPSITIPLALLVLLFSILLIGKD